MIKPQTFKISMILLACSLLTFACKKAEMQTPQLSITDRPVYKANTSKKTPKKRGFRIPIRLKFGPLPHQCQLEIKTPNLAKGEKDVCSGTFINQSHFVTSAQCFRLIDLVAQPQKTDYYQVKCPGQKAIKVQAINLHPLAYITKSTSFDSKQGQKINNDSGEPTLLSYNSIAVLITEPTTMDKFPKIPDGSLNAKTFNKNKNGCLSKTFHASSCKNKNGRGCLISQFKLKLDSFEQAKVNEHCDIISGEDCHLVEKWNEKANSDNPLMFDLSLPQNPFAAGDAGSGIYCRGPRGQNHLSGLFINDKSPAMVNVGIKLGFIKSVTEGRKDKLIKKPIIPDFDSNYISLLQTIVNIEEQLTKGNSPILISEKFTGADLSFLKDLQQWLNENPDGKDLLQQKFVVEIVKDDAPVSASEKVTLVPQVGHAENNLIKIHDGATIDDFIEAIKP